MIKSDKRFIANLLRGFEGRTEKLKKEFANLRGLFSSLKKRFEKVEGSLDSFGKRNDDLENNLVEIKSRFYTFETLFNGAEVGFGAFKVGLDNLGDIDKDGDQIHVSGIELRRMEQKVELMLGGLEMIGRRLKNFEADVIRVTSPLVG